MIEVYAENGIFSKKTFQATKSTKSIKITVFANLSNRFDVRKAIITCRAFCISGVAMLNQDPILDPITPSSTTSSQSTLRLSTIFVSTRNWKVRFEEQKTILKLFNPSIPLRRSKLLYLSSLYVFCATNVKFFCKGWYKNFYTRVLFICNIR